MSFKCCTLGYLQFFYEGYVLARKRNYTLVRECEFLSGLGLLSEINISNVTLVLMLPTQFSQKKKVVILILTYLKTEENITAIGFAKLFDFLLVLIK